MNLYRGLALVQKSKKMNVEPDLMGISSSFFRNTSNDQSKIFALQRAILRVTQFLSIDLIFLSRFIFNNFYLFFFHVILFLCLFLF